MFYLVQIFDSLRHDGDLPVAFTSRTVYANALEAVEELSAEYRGIVTDSKVEAVYR